MERKLTYLLRRLKPEQRAELCGLLGISQETFYRRCNEPGKFTLDEATALASFLEGAFEVEMDFFHLMYSNVELPTASALRA